MTVTWGLPRRLAFRFGLLYLGLYELPWILKRPLLPGGRKLAESIGSLEPVVRWFGHHVLRLQGSMPKEYPAGGDTLFEWVRSAFLVAVALVVAGVWTILDGKRRSHPLLADALRTYVRYGLAFTMMSYGVMKILPVQFAPPGLGMLLEPYGDSSPMGLLWTFMGASRSYSIACGVVELLGAVLLLWRRTTFIGASLLVVATANVLLLNLSYGVPVKLYSAHLLVMALFLAAPDGLRVAASVLGRKPVTLPASASSAVLPYPALERARPWAKALLITWCSFATLFVTVRLGIDSARPQPPALFGVWLVDAFEPAPGPGAAWHHVVVNEWGELMVERLDDERVWFESHRDPGSPTLELTSKAQNLTLACAQADPDHLTLEGDIAGSHVRMQLHRVKKAFLLTTRGFRWIQEEGFNR
ncbi:MAG: hypothetical protein ACRELB_06955 [Polyangiaceae bacterium]